MLRGQSLHIVLLGTGYLPHKPPVLLGLTVAVHSSGHGRYIPLFRHLCAALVVCICSGSLQAASIVLKWTAPGDDGKSGRASQYDLRYSTLPMTSANWQTALRVDGLARPLPYGNKEIVTVRGLLPSTTYYFAIKAADELWNWSPMSNVIQRTTCAGCVGTTGNVNGSSDGRTDLLDLSLLVNYMTANNSGIQICFEEANVDASLDGLITISDLSLLVAYITGSRTLPDCP